MLKELPSNWRFYADLFVELIEKHSKLTRVEFVKYAMPILSTQGYDVTGMDTIGGTNYKTPYYRLGTAITGIKKGGGVWKGMTIVKTTVGKDITYEFAKGIQESLQDTRQTSITDDMEIKELPDDLLSKKKKKRTIAKNLPNHVVTSQYREIETLLNAGIHLKLEGIPGIGKTWNAEYWGLKNGWKTFKVVLTRESAEWQLLGRSNLILTYAEIKGYARDKDAECVKECDFRKIPCKAIRKGSIQIMMDTWIDGEFTAAIRHAASGNDTLLIVDEVNFGDQSVVAGTMNPILEEKKTPSLNIKDTGEVLTFNRDNFRCVVTMNPGTSGTNPLNEAFSDRFIDVPCEMPAVWKKIALSQVGKEPSQLLQDLFIKIRDTVIIRKTVALRSIIKWTKLEKIYGDIGQSRKLQKLVNNQFKDGDKNVVREIMKGIF